MRGDMSAGPAVTDAEQTFSRSKEGLRGAVDGRAVVFFEEMIGELARIGADGGSASLAELFAGRLERERAMRGYVRRLLADGGEAADALFGKLFDATVAGMRSPADAGIVRPAHDERIRTAFLLANDLSLVLLRRQITRGPGKRAADQPPAREDPYR